jgi:beta-galactosidase
MNLALRLTCALLALLTFATPALAVGRERLSLDAGWLFHLGEVATPPVKGLAVVVAHAMALDMA